MQRQEEATNSSFGTQNRIFGERFASVALGAASVVEFRRGHPLVGIVLMGLSAVSAYRVMIDSQGLENQRREGISSPGSSVSETLLGAALAVEATIEAGTTAVYKGARGLREALSSSFI